MGYTTEFDGCFKLSQPLSVEQKNELDQFAEEIHTRPIEGYCQWIPTLDGTGITWDGGEKFYDYVAWLKLIIRRFLRPWGLVLNGQVTWQGEESDDMGMIEVIDSVVSTKKAEIVYV